MIRSPKSIPKKPKRLPALQPEAHNSRWDGFSERFKRIINNAPTPKPTRPVFEGSKYEAEDDKPEDD